MGLKDRARDIWSQTRVLVWPESYVLASLSRARLGDAAALVAAAAQFAALVVERDEVSVTVAESSWAGSDLARSARAGGPFRAITLDVDIDLDVCGYLAPAAAPVGRGGRRDRPSVRLPEGPHPRPREGSRVRRAGSRGLDRRLSE